MLPGGDVGVLDFGAVIDEGETVMVVFVIGDDSGFAGLFAEVFFDPGEFFFATPLVAMER